MSKKDKNISSKNLSDSKKIVRNKKPFRIRIAEVASFAKSFAPTLKGGEIIALIGPLGAGKTTFTKHLGAALGIKKNITSPTFIFSQDFTTPLKNPVSGKKIVLHHLDLYRLNHPKEAALIGLHEFWGQPNTITIIEWADKILPLLPKQTIYIHFV